MSNEYYKGQKVRLSATFTVSSTPTDPSTISLIVKEPDGTSTTYTYALTTVTKDDTGDYHKDIDADDEGIWKYGFVGTGAVATAKFDEFVVRAWPFS